MHSQSILIWPKIDMTMPWCWSKLPKSVWQNSTINSVCKWKTMLWIKNEAKTNHFKMCRHVKQPIQMSLWDRYIYIYTIHIRVVIVSIHFESFFFRIRSIWGRYSSLNMCTYDIDTHCILRKMFMFMLTFRWHTHERSNNRAIENDSRTENETMVNNKKDHRKKLKIPAKWRARRNKARFAFHLHFVSRTHTQARTEQ